MALTWFLLHLAAVLHVHPHPHGESASLARPGEPVAFAFPAHPSRDPDANEEDHEEHGACGLCHVLKDAFSHGFLPSRALLYLASSPAPFHAAMQWMPAGIRYQLPPGRAPPGLLA